MKELIEKLEHEYKELDHKIYKLSDFIRDKADTIVTKHHLELMERQLKAMIHYQKILQERIDDLKKHNKE